MTRTKHHDPNYIGNDREIGAFAHDYHLEMVSDPERVGRIKKAVIGAASPSKSFCEFGCGTGIFTAIAARHYGRVFAVERDETILAIAKDTVKRAGVEDRVKFIHADATEVAARSLGGGVDVSLMEMLSIWMINEPQQLVANHVSQKLMRPGGTMIPGFVTNLLECGNHDFAFEDVVIRAPIAQFSGVRAPRILTVSAVGYSADLSKVNPDAREGTLMLTALADDTINCVRLSSIVRFGPGATFYSTDTLMPVTIVPTLNELSVRAGDQVRIDFSFRHRAPVQQARFEVSKI